MGKFKKMKKVLICLFSFLFIASATVAGGVLLSGSSYSVPVSESSGEEIQDNENLTNDNNNATSNATEPLNDGNWTGSGNYDTTFAGGTGTESDPYLISTARQLAGLAYWTNISTSTTYNSSSVYYRQTADIDLSAYWWDAIGRSGSNYYFRGHYDGGGHTVSGVFTQRGSTDAYSYQGLFGYVYGTSTNKAEISNVGVINSNIQGYKYVAGIAGYAQYTNITNCYNTGTVTGSGDYVGGVVGGNYQATVENSYNTGLVTGTQQVGGVVGRNTSSSKVINSYNTGTVTGSSSNVGGVVGYNYSSSTVTNSYNTGSVTGSSSNVGGVVGQNSSSSTVSNSYNTGDVTGSGQYVGGVVGSNAGSSTVSNSYNTGDVTSTYTGTYGYVGGVVGYNDSTVTNSYNTGSVTASSQRVGGITGYNYGSSARVNNTYNIGNVSGTSYVAGIVGYNYNGADVYNSFNTGSVTGTGSYVGAIVGRNYSGSPTVYNCYWGVNCTLTSAGTNSGGTISNCSRFSSDSDPETESWYTTTSNWYSSYTWNFSSIWGISQYVNDGLPFLRGVGVGANLPTNYDLFWTDSGVTRDTTFAGSGTEDDPYLISSAQELAGLAYMTNISTSTTYNNNDVYYLQTADIDVSAYWWDAIGTSTSSTYYFQGHYDGDGHTVSGIFTPAGSNLNYSYQGLFGFVYGSSTNRLEISNVGVINSNIQGYKYVAGIAGGAQFTNITNCYNTGSVTGSSQYIGGVVGYNTNSTVSNSYNTGDVTSTYTGTYGYVGGVVGQNSLSTVSNSYNTGIVTGSSSVGGVVGRNEGGSSTVTNCYNTGTVTGSSSVGGVVGYNSSTVSNCYYGGDCTLSYGIGSSSSNSGASENTNLVSDAKTLSWYQDSSKWNSEYPWDFETVWAFEGINDGYPVLVLRKLKTLKINLITAGRVSPSVSITTSGGTLDSNNILSTTTSENVINVNFENTNLDMNVFIAFNEEPTSESSLNSATYAWDLTNGEVLNVYVYQRRVVTYHSNDTSNESISYEYIGNETITTISNPFEVEDGYHFSYWNTNSVGTGTNYSQNANITSSFNYDLGLYAKISGDVYNITFNHGIGTNSTYYLKYGTGLYGSNPGDSSASAPLENIAPITRDGYTFHGYYTGENGTGEQIIDENGNVVGSPTFTLSPTTIYAYWTVNVPAYYDEAGGYWYIEYGKMPQTKLDSTVEADRIVINALDGDNVLDDTDGVTASSNIYYFAGNMLTSKIYNGEEYSYFLGNWYKVEPIKWVLNTEASSSQSGYISTDTLAVMESVVYVGKYSTSSIGLNNGYSNSVFVEDFYNNFNINERNYLNQFTVSAEQFTSQGTTSSTISDSYIYLSSQEEIATICGGTATEFSDLVLDYLSIFGEGNYYFVRDLGSNLNSVTCYTQGGGELNQAPTSTLGMRFTIQVNEFVCLE